MSGPDVPSLDPEEALQLTQRGGTLVCLGLPAGREFGVDLRSYTVGDRFGGMKMIPTQGVHFLVFGTDMDRTGCFVSLAPSEVAVFRWDAAVELLLPLAPAEAAPHAAAASSLSLDASLGPYPLGTWGEWAALTQHISPAALARAAIAPPTLVGPSAAEDLEALPAGAGASAARRRSRCAQAEAVQAEANVAAPAAPAATGERAGSCAAGGAAGGGASEGGSEGGGGCGGGAAAVTATARYVEADPHALRPDGSRGVGGRRGGALTSFLLDRSEWLGWLLAHEYSPPPDSSRPPARAADGLSACEAGLLGELQLSFLLFLRLSCLASLEQWKRLVSLLCGCEAALKARTALFVGFVQALRAQLAFAPPDFFDDELSADNFLRSALGGLAARAGAEPLAKAEGQQALAPALAAELARLRAFALERFRIDIEVDLADEDEDEPTVVELPTDR